MDRDRRVYDDVFGLLPSPENPTPMVRLNRLNPFGGFDLYAKLEWFNPFGSIKDRAAGFMIRDLEERGELRHAGPDDAGRGVVEPTSGNTGISLATMAAAKGYRMRAVVPNKIPLEKKVLLKIAGAELDVVNDNLCPNPGMGEGSIGIAKSHAKAQPNRYVMPNQYENRQNILAHETTTGPEIWNQTEGRVTHFFASLGTAGTIVGAGRYLKSKNPGIKVVVIAPTEGHDVPGLRTVSELPNTNLFDESIVDEIIEVDGELAYTRAVDLARSEGLLAGPSAGLVLEGAVAFLERHPPGAGVGVLMFADDMFKYVSNFIKHIPELAEGTSV